MELKIAELRKLKGVSQQQLADYLGVTFQSVSKWETKASFPDITLLPKIANYFGVSVDEVLGLVPICIKEYIPRDTDNREKWKNRMDVITNNRQFFWNDDYLAYLVREVWRITKPIDMIEFCCCNSDLGKRLMRILPEGSTYTGVDSDFLIKEAKENLKGVFFPYQLVVSDVYRYNTAKKYDLSICQASLRHMNHPKKILQNMIDSVKYNGLVVCAEVNRETEEDGLYIEGVDYYHLCTAFSWRKLWKAELENEGRDYAIGIRIPFYMKELGLHDVDVRMNDKVTFVTPDNPNYEELQNAIRTFRGWKEKQSESSRQDAAEFYIGRGYKREEYEKLGELQDEIIEQFDEKETSTSFLHYFGMLISFGRK